MLPPNSAVKLPAPFALLVGGRNFSGGRFAQRTQCQSAPQVTAGAGCPQGPRCLIRKALVLLAALGLAACTHTRECPPEAGLTPPNTTYGVLGGALLAPLEGKEFGIEHRCLGGVQALVLERLVSRDAKGQPTWQELDRLVLPEIGRKELLAYGYPCARDGKADPEIVAIVHLSDGPELTEIVRAWRADSARGRFEPINVHGITCPNPGAGV